MSAYNVPVKSREILEKQSRNLFMSSQTKDFIQKICYKKAASVDMTRFGFINDIKLHPVNMLLKPLREQLEKICGNSIYHKILSAKKESTTAQENVKKKRRVTIMEQPASFKYKKTDTAPDVLPNRRRNSITLSTRIN